MNIQNIIQQSAEIALIIISLKFIFKLFADTNRILRNKRANKIEYYELTENLREEIRNVRNLEIEYKKLIAKQKK